MLTIAYRKCRFRTGKKMEASQLFIPNQNMKRSYSFYISVLCSEKKLRIFKLRKAEGNMKTLVGVTLQNS